MLRFSSLLLVLISHTLADASDLSAVSASEIEAVLDAINSIRIREGVHALVHEEPASLAATLHARELAGRNLLSHRDINGNRVAVRYRLSGGTGTMAGENLGAGDSIEPILLAWMESPSHRDNLLNPEWHSVGIGQARTEKNRIILVAIFSNSRWKYSSLEIDGKVATLSGLLVYSGDPPRVFIRIDGKVFGSAPRRPGAKQTAFSFPVPQSWDEGAVVPISLSVVKHGVEKEVDLLLLKVPYRINEANPR